MGIDAHGLKFLLYTKKKKPLENVVTIGRQGIHIGENIISKIISVPPTYKNDAFCEKLLIEYFGATQVDSIDNSEYEHATYIEDMNKPISKELHQKYDTVVDFGSLEHIFNVAQSFNNCSSLCRAGGQIIHILPSNQFCGHGFYQFSPALFFSLYTDRNGYADTEVFVANTSDHDQWYKVISPSQYNRALIDSIGEMYVLVRTVKKESSFSHQDVQQNDYTYIWQQSSIDKIESTSDVKDSDHTVVPVKNFFLKGVIRSISKKLSRLVNRTRYNKNTHIKSNEYLERVSLKDILG